MRSTRLLVRFGPFPPSEEAGYLYLARDATKWELTSHMGSAYVFSELRYALVAWKTVSGRFASILNGRPAVWFRSRTVGEPPHKFVEIGPIGAIDVPR